MWYLVIPPLARCEVFTYTLQVSDKVFTNIPMASLEVFTNPPLVSRQEFTNPPRASTEVCTSPFNKAFTADPENLNRIAWQLTPPTSRDLERNRLAVTQLRDPE